MKNKSHQLINEYVALCRDLIGKLGELSKSDDDEFKILIKECFNLEFANYEYIIDCLYLLEDTQEANGNYLKYELDGPTKDSSDGERYLRFYGLMNSCYLQSEALICCSTKLSLPNHTENTKKLKGARILDFRHCFAAHPVDRKYYPNRKSQRSRSYVLCRIDLISDLISGYSQNFDENKDFKKAELVELVNEWNQLFLSQIKDIAENLIKPPSEFTRVEIKNIFDEIYKKLQNLNIRFDNPDDINIQCGNLMITVKGV